VVNQSQLEGAIDVLLDTYPILKHTVLDPNGNEPAYHLDTTIQCDDIVRVFAHSAPTIELVRQANLTGMTFRVDHGPLIQCQLHQATGSNQRDSLILLFDHILCDGLGGRNLFSDLLCLLSSLSLPAAPSGLPLRMDDTVDLTPTTAQAMLDPDYPPAIPSYDARGGKQILTDFALPAETLQNLLKVTKRHGVKTLHPVLHTAALMALYHAAGSPKPAAIRTSTPISERDEGKGHPRSTGNYVIFHYATTRVDSSLGFWEETRRFCASLRHPSARAGARSTESSGSQGWGSYLDGLIGKANAPVRLGVAVSNVGKLDLPQTGQLAGDISDVYFAQSSSAVGAAIVLSVSEKHTIERLVDSSDC
jgi:NRPS condensation-like uncharacterized protein